MVDTNLSEGTDVVPWYSKLKDAKDRTTLKPKHIVACVRHWLYNESAAQCAKSMGISPSHLADIFKSPAAKELRTYLNAKAGDPVQLAKDIAAANTLNVTLDWYSALEWAKDARDYKAVASMTKDLAALGGVQATPPKQQIETSKTIKIVFDGTSLDQEAVEADWEEIVDDEDDDDGP